MGYMKKLPLLLLLVPALAWAALSMKIAINFDDTVDTNFRDGTKPQGGGGCSTWTCASKGDADGDITEDTTTQLTIAASGTNDEGNIDYAYKSEATDVDLQIEARIPSGWTGYTENFTSFGVGISEGTGDSDYAAQVWWPDVGRARFKSDVGGAGEQNQLGATGQFVPRYLAITYDDSATSICGFESDDGITWSIIGTCVTKSIMFPAIAYLFGTSHDAAQTTTTTPTDVVFSTTIDITDGGAPTPPAGDDHTIATGFTGVYDCAVNSVKPGDTITLLGTARGIIRFQNCTGADGNDIIIRNDTSESGPLIISYSGSGFGNHCKNCKHVTWDGTGKWSGASSAQCGTTGSWPNVESTPQCGIHMVCSGGDPNVFGIKMLGSTTDLTIKGIEFDGNFDSVCSTNTGSTYPINCNDHSFSDPGGWRENILITNNFIHDTAGSGMYCGPNIKNITDRRLRNNVISYNHVKDIGCDGIKVKAWVEGFSEIHHNFVDTTGIRGYIPAVGCTGVGIYLFEAGFTDVHHNTIVNSLRASISQNTQALFKSDVATVPSSMYNNLIIDSQNNGIVARSKGSTQTEVIPTIYNNTVINSTLVGIKVNSFVSDCRVRGNIAAGNGTNISAGQCTNQNNFTGTEASQNFVNAAGNDFHLTSGSIARNKNPPLAPPTDHDDVSRPQQGLDDSGAYEFQP